MWWKAQPNKLKTRVPGESQNTQKKLKHKRQPLHPLKQQDSDSDTNLQDYLYTLKNKKTTSTE